MRLNLQLLSIRVLHHSNPRFRRRSTTTTTTTTTLTLLYILILSNILRYSSTHVREQLSSWPSPEIIRIAIKSWNVSLTNQAILWFQERKRRTSTRRLHAMRRRRGGWRFAGELCLNALRSTVAMNSWLPFQYISYVTNKCPHFVHPCLSIPGSFWCPHRNIQTQSRDLRRIRANDSSPWHRLRFKQELRLLQLSKSLPERWRGTDKELTHHRDFSNPNLISW